MSTFVAILYVMRNTKMRTLPLERLDQNLVLVVQEDVCRDDNQGEDVAVNQSRRELNTGAAARTGRLLASHQF